MALIAGLWLWSLPMTSGGWMYSTRMLSPLVVLACILGGWLGTLPPVPRYAAGVAVALLAADAALRSWFLPDFPTAPTWAFTPSEWRALRTADDARSLIRAWPVFISAAAGQAIATPNADQQVEIAQLGGRAIPFFSPQFAPAFDPQFDLSHAAARLRGAGIRFVLLDARNPITTGVAMRHRALRELQETCAPNARLPGVDVYDLYFLTPSSRVSRLSPSATSDSNADPLR
jgi:hypothetical protein